MVRLVFRPYTQVRRSICTLESLRTSFRISPDFVLFRHSSPSFGSQHVYSNSNLSPGGSWSVDSAKILPQFNRTFTLITRRGMNSERLHTCQTPWSVFQDGVIKTILLQSILIIIQIHLYQLYIFPTIQINHNINNTNNTRTLVFIDSFSAILGTLSLSFQNSFHLSLTVLVRYRSSTNIQL